MVDKGKFFFIIKGCILNDENSVYWNLITLRNFRNYLLIHKVVKWILASFYSILFHSKFGINLVTNIFLPMRTFSVE